MGLTLWGMALEPTSPALICCLKSVSYTHLDDERHGEEYERADDYQPRVGGRAAYGQLRRREEGDPQRRDKRPALLPDILHAVTLFRRREMCIRDRPCSLPERGH